MNEFEFYKYQGNGNDFIIIDSRNNDSYRSLISNNIFNVKKLCDRNFGIGADGLIFILNPDHDNDSKMIIFNSDGSEAEMCGNGIRCMIEYLNNQENSFTKKFEYRIETKAGLKVAKYNSGKISVRMGKPIFDNKLIPTKMYKNINDLLTDQFIYKDFNTKGYAVGMGNPHLIFFVEDLSLISHKELGPVFEKNDLFPDKTNVHFCQIINSEKIIVKVWERGAGSTLACGTGACAIHVAARKLSKCEAKTSIILPGGELLIEWNNIEDEVLMTGVANKVFKGSLNLL
tara:strand:+ start:494 stop:1354 length:861 start_codon:yes stop_codon:yes gene_type:complete